MCVYICMYTYISTQNLREEYKRFFLIINYTSKFSKKFVSSFKCFIRGTIIIIEALMMVLMFILTLSMNAQGLLKFKHAEKSFLFKGNNM